MNEEEMLDIIDRIIINNSLSYFGYNTVQVGYEALEKIVKQYKTQQIEYDLLLNGYNKLVQEHIKTEKVIDKMAQEIFIEYNPHFSTPEQVKEYFYKEIEND